MIRKLLIATASLMMAGICASAQTNEEFKAQYERQTSAVGPSGVGVEYIVNRWEKACPDSREMLEASFRLYFLKSREETLVVKPGLDKYMGGDPVLALTDSLGNKVNWFTDYKYNDRVFGKAVRYIDKAAELYADDIDVRFFKLDALLAYEKDSPDMVCTDLAALIDLEASGKQNWKAGGEPVGHDYFMAAVQDFCREFFKIASPASYEAFRTISEKMNKLYPSDTAWLNNLGSYWYSVQKNSSKALSYYKKVLKISPKDYTAIKNSVLIARKDNNPKLEKKFLPLLIEVTPSQGEKIAAEARLKQL